MSLAVALHIKTLSAQINTSKEHNKTIIIKKKFVDSCQSPTPFKAADYIQHSIHKLSP